MNRGAGQARSPWLFFLHADTRLSPELLPGLIDRMKRENPRDCVTVFSFRPRFRNPDPVYRTMERGAAWRSKTFGLAYGDQGLCVSRALFDRLEGFDESVLPEDLDFVLRLRSIGRIEMLPYDVHTSARQWEREGVVMGAARNLGRMGAGIALHYLHGRHRPRVQPDLES
jgi:GT2 family glycosyltransferase